VTVASLHVHTVSEITTPYVKYLNPVRTRASQRQLPFPTQQWLLSMDFQRIANDLIYDHWLQIKVNWFINHCSTSSAVYKVQMNVLLTMLNQVTQFKVDCKYSLERIKAIYYLLKSLYWTLAALRFPKLPKTYLKSNTDHKTHSPY
jgi:hypothetical protein